MTFSNKVPKDNLTPFVFVEFDESGSAGDSSAVQPFKILVLGQSLSSGTAIPGQLVKAQTPDLAAKYFGKGSQLHHMATALHAGDQTTERYFLSLKSDDESSPNGKLKGAIELKGKATSSGVQSLYIGDRSYRVIVQAGETAESVAKRLAAQINADELRYVDSIKLEGKSSTLPLVARQFGQSYESVAITTQHYTDDKAVPGIQASVKPLAGDVPNPEITDDRIDALGNSNQYNLVITAVHDPRNIAKLINEMDSRWGPDRQVDGHIVSCTHVSKEVFQTKKFTHFHTNSKHYSLFYNRFSATPAFAWSAAIGGAIAREIQLDPNRQLNEVAIDGVWSPKDEYPIKIRNDILRGGVSTWKLDAAGKPLLERVVTQYLTSSSGERDSSYRDLTTKATLSYLRYDWRVHIKNKYKRHKLADDGTRFREGLPIVTPSVIRAELLTKYQRWEFDGLVEGYDLFKKGLIVIRNPNDRDRIDCKLKPDIVNQLRTQSYVFAFLI